jgi:hypothetical protein
MTEEKGASQSINATGNATGSEVQKPTWIEQLPEDMRGDESLYGHKTIGDLVKAHKAGMAERGNLIKVPGDDATAEEKANFYSKLGRPETPDKYSFTKPEGFPDDLPYSKEGEQAYKQLVHDAGLSDASAKKVYAWYHDAIAKGHKEEQAATQKAINSLKDEWPGEAFKVNNEKAHRAFAKFGTDEMLKLFEATKVAGISLGDHPLVVKAFAKIHDSIAEDSANVGRNHEGRGLSKEERARLEFPNTKW